MRKRVLYLSLLFALVAFPARLQAAPPLLPSQQEPRAVITSPRSNAQVRGKVLISGSATHPNFWKYELAYGPEPNPGNQWILIGQVHENQVSDGVLETWDTALVPDGSYILRLRVVDISGNYQEYLVPRISIANTQPTETPTPARPTPTPTPSTPTPTPTPLPATPTIVVQQPPTPTPAPSPTPSLTREPTQPAMVDAPSSFDPRQLGGAFCYGVGGMASLFVLFGLLSLLRRLILALR